jgi:hypothetical protein
VGLPWSQQFEISLAVRFSEMISRITFLWQPSTARKETVQMVELLNRHDK